MEEEDLERTQKSLSCWNWWRHVQAMRQCGCPLQIQDQCGWQRGGGGCRPPGPDFGEGQCGGPGLFANTVAKTINMVKEKKEKKKKWHRH